VGLTRAAGSMARPGCRPRARPDRPAQRRLVIAGASGLPGGDLSQQRGQGNRRRHPTDRVAASPTAGGQQLACQHPQLPRYRTQLLRVFAGHGRRGRTGRLPSSPLHISTGTQGGGQVGGRRCDSVAVIIAGARGSDDARIGDARQRLAAAQVAGKGVRILPLTAACAAAATGGSRVAIATAGAARSAPDGVGRARANRPRTAARRQGCRRAGAAGPGAGRRVGRGCTD
jgi:hypothetical protein